MDQTSLWFLEYLKRLNLKRNLLEQEFYNSSRNQELKELLKIEKSLVYFLNSLKADELLLMKMNRTDFLKTRENEDHVDYFEDIIVDYSQGLDMANVHTNILSGIMDTYATIISNNFNIFIQRLTFVTIILQVPTLIASFYGMNIKLPFSEFKYIFFVLLFCIPWIWYHPCIFPYKKDKNIIILTMQLIDGKKISSEIKLKLLKLFLF